MSVEKIIIDRIRTEGPISFRDFMEMALYYPEEGYYTSPGDKIGQSGDFYTSPYLTTLFGELVAAQLEEMWHLLDRQPFTIVEQGAGTGLLCRDILHRLATNKELYDPLNYIIIEKSASMREKGKRLLSTPPVDAESPIDLPAKVTWVDSIDDIPPVTGCIFSNELIDNFSVHQVVMEDELMEVFVDYQDGFIERLRPAPAALKEYLRELQVSLPAGFRTEICLEAVKWIQAIANNLHKGFVMTIDYGYPSSDLYCHSKKTGTLVCYHRHQVSDCPYEHVGRQDITTHVNFSALDHRGAAGGLEKCGYTNQACFLRGLGLAAHLRRLEEKNGRLPATREQLLRVHHQLMEMGSKFKVLIQRKGLRPAFLSGLQFPQRLV